MRVVESSVPWVESGDAPPLPRDRAPADIISQGIADPLYDYDIFPITIVNSRWLAFLYRVEETTLRRLLPRELELEDDVIEFWYSTHRNTSLGPYNEMGVTIATSIVGDDGRRRKVGYYPYMFLDQAVPLFAGIEIYGFGKKIAHIPVVEHGGGDDEGDPRPLGDYFSVALERRGYLIHTATGRYDDVGLPEMPALYRERAEYGRVNLRLLTDPTLRTTRWEFAVIPPSIPERTAQQIGRPERAGTPRFTLRPDTVRTASERAIRSWALQATPFDNLGHFLPVADLIGAMAFDFDIVIPPAEVVRSRFVERTDEDMAALHWATPFRYGMRQRFPKPPGA